MRLNILLIFSSFLLSLSPHFISAQAVSFNVKGGLNLSNMAFEGPDAVNNSGNITTGFHVGAFVELPFNNKFGLETGLLLQSKGFKSEFTSSFFDPEEMDSISYSGDQTTSLLYLDVPILFKSRFAMGGMNLIASAGPYFGFGLSGTRFFEYTFEGQQYEEESVIDWGDNGDFKSVDYGVMVSIGVEFSELILSASYVQGLANIETINPEQNTTTHQNIMISIGFRLGNEE